MENNEKGNSKILVFVYNKQPKKCFCCGSDLDAKGFKIRNIDFVFSGYKCSNCKNVYINEEEFNENKEYLFPINATDYSGFEKCRRKNLKFHANRCGVNEKTKSYKIMDLLFSRSLNVNQIKIFTSMKKEEIELILGRLLEQKIIVRSLNGNVDAVYSLQNNVNKWRKLNKSNSESKNHNSAVLSKKPKIKNNKIKEDTFDKKLNQLINNCDFTYKSYVFSREKAIRDYWMYLVNESKKEKATIFTLNTGSILFDVTLIIFASFLAILQDKTTSSDFVYSLEKGDKILFEEESTRKNSRFKFDSIKTINGVEYACIIQEFNRTSKGRTSVASEKRTISKKNWHLIKPYFGTSEQMNGLGLKKGNHLTRDFFKEVLKTEEPALIKNTSVILCNKIIYNEIFDDCGIIFNNKKILLNEIVTASYMTDNAEILHGGNVSKSDSVLKFTSSVLVAKEQLVDEDRNKVVGVFVIGEDIIHRNITEYPSLMKKRKLPFFLASAKIGTPSINELITDDIKINFYAFTKERASLYSGDIVSNNYYTELLNQQIDNIACQIQDVKRAGKLYDAEKINDLIKNLQVISKADFESTEKDLFVRESFSLLKQFITITFPIDILNQMVEDKIIESESLLIDRIHKIEEIATSLPLFFNRNVNEVIEVLNGIYKKILTRNNKENAIKDIIKNHNKQVGIIVPKSYFEKVYRYIGLIPKKGKKANQYHVMTPSTFASDINYDVIILVGILPYSRKFNPFICPSTKNIIFILYDNEIEKYKIRKKMNENLLRCYEGQDLNTLNKIDSNVNNSNDDIIKIEQEVESFINKINSNANLEYFVRNSSRTSNKEITAVRIAKFETGETAFFSKQYRAYVFDETAKEVKEVKVIDLEEGNQILFIKNDENTKDIVDKILARLIEMNLLTEVNEKYYQMSKYWKKVLMDFRINNRLSTRQLYELLKNNDITVELATIRNWLDEDSHIVCPNEPSNLLSIGKTVDDSELINNFEAYYSACKEIKRIRKMIRKKIAETIIRRMSGIAPKKDKLDIEIYHSVESVGLLLEITKLINTEKNVSIHLINRPLII